MIPDGLLSSFRDTLVSGKYNLLLGSGVCLDSQNHRGDTLQSSASLRRHLCNITHMPEDAPLQRVFGILDEEQVRQHVIDPFSGCRPGPSLSNLPHYLWRRLFTFNIDDVLEALYQTTPRKKQELDSLNYISPFEPTPLHSRLHETYMIAITISDLERQRAL